MARPFIREPAIPNQIHAGRRGQVDGVSCDMCTELEGGSPLQRRRVDMRNLLERSAFRMQPRIGAMLRLS